MIKPLNNRVIVQVKTAAPKEIAGLIIANQKSPVEEGVIVAVSDKEQELVVGQTVIIPTGVGITLPEGRLLVREDIWGVYA